MAETENANVGARKDIIVSVMKEVTALEGERKEIGEKIRSLKNTKIKGDLGMKIGDFNIALRLYNLEGNDRDELLDTVRETFEALGVGDQLDWVQASNRMTAGASVEVEGDGEEGDEEEG